MCICTHSVSVFAVNDARQGATVSRMASHGDADCLSTHSIINLNVHPHTVPSLTISPSLPQAFPRKSSSMPGKQTQPVIDFWLNVHILLSPVTSTNLTNTNLISNNRHWGAACQLRCALKRLSPTLGCLAFTSVSHQPFSVSFSFYGSQHMHAVLLFHVDYITA